MIYPFDNIFNIQLRDRSTGLIITGLDTYPDIRVFVYGKNSCLIQKFDVAGAVDFKLLDVTTDTITVSVDRANMEVVKDTDKIFIEILTVLTDADFQDSKYVSAGVATVDTIRPLSYATSV